MARAQLCKLSKVICRLIFPFTSSRGPWALSPSNTSFTVASFRIIFSRIFSPFCILVGFLGRSFSPLFFSRDSYVWTPAIKFIPMYRKLCERTTGYKQALKVPCGIFTSAAPIFLQRTCKGHVLSALLHLLLLVWELHRGDMWSLFWDCMKCSNMRPCWNLLAGREEIGKVEQGTVTSSTSLTSFLNIASKLLAVASIVSGYIILPNKALKGRGMLFMYFLPCNYVQLKQPWPHFCNM